ncbi:MAG: hypothetical protein NT169_20690 [Chloroflexi bacterium]|nr:hypothetical protein [Chloroflexota bacterium]
MGSSRTFVLAVNAGDAAATPIGDFTAVRLFAWLLKSRWLDISTVFGRSALPGNQ